MRQCYCHPLYKPFFKHQQKCRTKIPLKILPGIQKSSLKISITKIGKNFSVFSVILKILENFGFVIWKYINSQIFSTQYDFNAMSQKKYNFVLSLRFWTSLDPIWGVQMGSITYRFTFGTNVIILGKKSQKFGESSFLGYTLASGLNTTLRSLKKYWGQIDRHWPWQLPK